MDWAQYAEAVAYRSLHFVREAPPTLVALAFVTLLLGSAVFLYSFVFLLAPIPRPSLPSEKTYKTILPDGSTSSPQPLPCWLDSHVARKNLARRKQGKTTSVKTKLLEDFPLEDAELFMSVVIPAYNEAERLGGMLSEAVDFLQNAYGDAHGPKIEEQKPSTSAMERRVSGNGITVTPVNGSPKQPPGSPKQPGTKKSTSGRGWEILIVSDGSTDGTVDTALSFARDHQLEQYPAPIQGPWNKKPASTHIPHGSIRVISLEENRGKGGAVVHGMRHVRGEYVVFADADGASKFDDLAGLVEGVKRVEDKERRGVGIGSRAHLVGSEAVVKRSRIRNFLMHSFHLLLRLMTPPATSRIRDTQCGFKLFSRASLPYIVPYMHSEGWIFDVEMLMLAELGNIPMIEVPVGWKEVLGSKLNVLKDSLGMAWGLAILRLAWAMGVYRRS
ncbi:MAG: dolichyl-phosphate beta-glucosyltransferase [Bogoriella megaspora]|nr:MAG: dolichyl-phosphate beta-glucosyltransferase [Bogoriella megaspora]